MEAAQGFSLHGHSMTQLLVQGSMAAKAVETDNMHCRSCRRMLQATLHQTDCCPKLSSVCCA
jgi:hypothetical protein